MGPRDVLSAGLCIGCGSCVAQADPPAPAMVWNKRGQLQPAGPADWLRHGEPAFARTCPFSPDARDEDALARRLFPDADHADGAIGRFEAAYVGHVAEADFRAHGSSGGMVSWVAAELLRQGLVDGIAHVIAVDPQREGRFFRYTLSRTVDEVRAGAKSRYYPIEMSAVLRQIRATPGRYAVVGIPCFIKAVNLLAAEDPLLRARIAFTLGLFCGHMKSARLVESFAWQMGVAPADIERVEFRRKDPGRPANWYTAELTLRDGRRLAKDWWHLVDGDWGSGFFQHSACNFCDDVTAETADIAFGDAWVEPYASDGRGTNVVIVRSPRLAALVRDAIGEGRLALDPVDARFVEQTQAAGLRQRREGLAYRLGWGRRGLRPRKRVAVGAEHLPLRRKLLYRMRSRISAGSHRMFRWARLLHMPRLYTGWGRIVLTLYHGLAYSRGPIGALLDRLVPRGGGAA
ncbi:MAG TPA: Coenzyme F420 hydrogenase/dehydrogenase, beta subunit C-terminal domain [Sphingomonadaceae bacterium]|nr:Coenzyme F420 hydrogenase/dehydrogenase, beta subunit C-terminal domain [Sphingomonadaceae bacterium]